MFVFSKSMLIIGRRHFSFLIIVLFCYSFNYGKASLSRISDDLGGDAFVALRDGLLASLPHSSVSNGMGLRTVNGTETIRGRLTQNALLPCRANEVMLKLGN